MVFRAALIVAIGALFATTTAMSAEKLRPGGAGNRIIKGGEKLAPKDPGVAYATTTITCGDKAYEVSTGNKGDCNVQGVEGDKYYRADCATKDGKNSAGASCELGCNSSTGSGSCKVKSLK